MNEVNWREIFQLQEIPEPYTGLPTAPGECNQNCLEAKELVCVCRCHGRNHGARLKAAVQPLDQFNERDTTPLDVEVIVA